MTALTDVELMAWLDRTSSKWRELLEREPQVMRLPCGIRETATVAELLQHTVAVELRYAERLNEMPATRYEELPFDSVPAIYATHERALTLVDAVRGRDAAWWEEWIEFQTRSAGTVQASRRVVLVHLAMHSIRHYAQLATLVREHGVDPGWPMDYLFMAM